MTVSDLPALNAILNSISSILLLAGYYYIRRKNELFHKRFMISATVVSSFFMVSYLIYHYAVGSVPYPYYDWTRVAYFVILIPHIILAGIMAPVIIALLFLALSKRYEKHRRLARVAWPTWMFVSLSGIAIYLMLYKM